MRQLLQEIVDSRIILSNSHSTQPLTPSEANEFTELLRLANAGDSAAQCQLCEQYEQQVRIVARVLLGAQLRPYLDSIDLLQSVHRSLLAGIRDQRIDISTPEKLVGLACTMVRRKIARKWRVHRKQIRLEHAGTGEAFLFSTLSSLSNQEQPPDKQAEFNNSLAHLCNSLSEIERTMLQRRLEGYTTGEVAQELGMQPVAIRVRWTRQRQRLEETGVCADWL